MNNWFLILAKCFSLQRKNKQTFFCSQIKCLLDLSRTLIWAFDLFIILEFSYYSKMNSENIIIEILVLINDFFPIFFSFSLLSETSDSYYITFKKKPYNERVKHWNKITKKVVKSSTLETFKTQLDKVQHRWI